MHSDGYRSPRSFGRANWLGVRTLFARELGRYWKEWPETVVAPVFSTLVYIAVFALALGPDRGTEDGRALLQFMMPGVVLFAVILRSAEATVFTIVFDKLEGIISDVLMPPLSPMEIVVAYVLAGAAGGLVTGLPVLAAASLVVGVAMPAPALAFLFAAASALLLSLVGFLVGIWAARWDHVQGAFSFGLIPLIFLSGLSAPVDALPAPLELIVRLNPVYYGIDGFRGALTGEAAVPPLVSLSILTVTTGPALLLAVELVRRGYKLKA